MNKTMKTKVSFSRCPEYATDQVYAAVKRSVDLLGGMSQFVKPGERILLKPNLLSARKPERCVTTHPEVVRAAARLVREAGAIPFIGDSPGGAVKGVEHVWRETGMYDVAKQENVELLNFETAGSVETKTNHKLVPSVYISKIVFEIDGIINLPKLKTHGLATFTGAVKNFYGCIPGFRKGEYHKLIPPYADDFGSFLADIYLAIEHKVRLNIMDGIIGMEGDGPAQGDLRELGIVAASKDAPSLDTAVTSMLGFDPRKIGTLSHVARMRKLPGSRCEVEAVGAAPSEFDTADFKFPQTWFFNMIPRVFVRALGSLIWMKPVIAPEICTACMMCVNSCPVKAIEKPGKKPAVIPEKCISCLCCHELCPVKAIYLDESGALKFYHWFRHARKEYLRQLQHYVEFAGLWAFAAAVRIFPLNAARFLARRFADFVFFCVPVRKKVVIGNLTESFKSEKTPAEISKIARSAYQQFTMTMIELLYFPKLSREDIKNMVAIEGLDTLADIVKRGKGAIIVGAHFGNWELMGAAFAQHYPITFIVGQQSNIMADDLLNSYRLDKGIKIVPLKLSLRGVMKCLKDNEFVALLSDQDAHEHGVFVDFFGRPASTPKGPAVFALRSGSPLVMASMFREKNGFRARFEEVPRPVPSGVENTDILNYTQEYTRLLEKYTRQRPDHWFWMHRRWKTKKP